MLKNKLLGMSSYIVEWPGLCIYLGVVCRISFVDVICLTHLVLCGMDHSKVQCQGCGLLHHSNTSTLCHRVAADTVSLQLGPHRARAGE